MTTEAANLKPQRVSSSEQYSLGGEGTQSGERVKNTVVTLSVRLHNGNNGKLKIV